MNERLNTIRERALKREYSAYQNIEKSAEVFARLTALLQDSNMSDTERMTVRFEQLLASETPTILEDENLVFIRTITKIPDIYSAAEMDALASKYHLHEAGYVCNIAADYAEIIEGGLNTLLARIDSVKAANTEYAQYLTRCVNAIIDISDRYAAEAEAIGRKDIAELLANIPRKGAATFKEALQFFRILHFALWMSGSYHNVVGRFDQYMYPYYMKDIENGTLTKDSALELLEEWFLSFSKDSELYPGVQQGDNGQSMVLGGYTEDGADGFNALSELCLQASLNVRLIDPKINLRVNKQTTQETYNLATLLTKQGLGFPQYANDDVVIDGLLALGYDYKDAVNYVTAACWEFIVPGCAMDIPNIGALSFLGIVNDCVNNRLTDCADFDALFDTVSAEIKARVKEEVSKFESLYIIPSPVMTLFQSGNVAQLADISLGAKYNNFGIHGTGIANAADSLYAIKKHVFEDKTVDKDILLTAIAADFAENAALRNILRYETPKMGMDNDDVDDIAIKLLDVFAAELATYTNCRGGIYKGGTGSAMYYIWHSKELGASADGRCTGEPLSANYSPGLDVGSKNPLSVVKSFTKADMKKLINGGPLTIELHDTVFRNDAGIEKTAMLVSEYIRRGGHQMQINAVNREALLKAQKEPEKYKNLIVRVWGWSGYFVELDAEYQDHIIRRTEYEY